MKNIGFVIENNFANYFLSKQNGIKKPALKAGFFISLERSA